MLYLVATPIGNLEDITLRALRILKEANLVVAEDTRHTGFLLKHFEISKPMLSYHSHSPESQLQKIVRLLREGKNIALASDAGTPGISDPAYSLIQAAIAENLPFTAIPGPTAAITALVLSGFSMHRFLFLGFLPLKKGRQTLLQSLREMPYTIVFYESPHRILKTLDQLKTALGSARRIALCREMTKMFEEVFRGTIEEAILHFTQKSPRGEFTIAIGT